MGGSKAMLMEHEDNVASATSYLVKKGYLERCEWHDFVYEGGGGPLDDTFYRNAMADRKRGDSGPVPWAAELDSREYTDLLKEAYEEHCADECNLCAKHRDE